jgi:hypothetical protein
MAANKTPSSCRKYKDKISAHNQHQNKTETDFSTIMAEMQELKNSAAKPEPQITIPTQNSYEHSQGHFHGSLPNLNAIKVNYHNHQSDFQHSSNHHRESLIQDTNRLVPPSLSRYSGGGIIRQCSVERREYFATAPYSRSRSPSPNTNTQVKLQPVILSHRETYRPQLSQTNSLQIPNTPSGRQRSQSE